MDTPGSRRFVIVALVIWAISLPLLGLILPPQPRLVICAPYPSSIIGATNDGRTIHTSFLAADDDTRGWLPTGKVQVWDLATGRERPGFQLERTETAPPIANELQRSDGEKQSTRKLSRIVLAPGGQALAYDYRSTFWLRGSLRLKSLDFQSEFLRVEGCSLEDVVFSPDGKWIAIKHWKAANSWRTMRLFNAKTGEELALEETSRPFERFGGFAFSPDSQLCALTEKTGETWQTYVWQLEPLRLRCRVEGYNFVLAISPDGRLLACVQDHAKVLVRESDTGKTCRELTGHIGSIWAVTFGPDNRTLTALDDLIARDEQSLNRATTWDLATGQVLTTFVPPVEQQLCTDPNKDNTRTPLIWAQLDKPVWRVFDAARATQVAMTPEYCLPARVSPNNRVLITHGDGNLSNTASPDDWLRWLREHIPGLKKVWPDGERLQMWDLTTGKELASFNSGAGSYHFTPDGNTLILGTSTDRYEVWDVPPGWPIKLILTWSLPLPVLVLLIGEWRLRRRQKKLVYVGESFSRLGLSAVRRSTHNQWLASLENGTIRCMDEFRLFAHGRSFDVDTYLTTTRLEFDYVRRKEHAKNSAGRDARSSVSIALGNGAKLFFDEQQKIATEFLSRHSDALRDLGKFPGVETFILGLQYNMVLEVGTVGFCVSFSNELMWHALDVGVELVCYVAVDWDQQWAEKVAELGL